MKFKKITFMALTALLTLSLGACSLIGQKHSQKNQGGTENSSRESQKNTSSDDIEELLEKAETANEDLTSMKMKVKLSITVDGSNKTQTMSGDLLYDKSTDELAKGHLIIDGKRAVRRVIKKRLCQAERINFCILVLLKMEHGLSKKWEAGQIIMFSPIISNSWMAFIKWLMMSL